MNELSGSEALTCTQSLAEEVGFRVRVVNPKMAMQGLRHLAQADQILRKKVGNKGPRCC
jgi:hypothetical protein